MALVVAGCGGDGGGPRSTACSALDIPAVTRAADASRALRSAVAADRAALDVLAAGDPLAARFRGAKARAEQALASFTGDPLRSGSMSPSATVLPTAQRVVAETHALRAELCG
ncbi:MAG: hypothetical protein ACM3QU_01185 [Verrucomicrobiota bacterium]